MQNYSTSRTLQKEKEDAIYTAYLEIIEEYRAKGLINKIFRTAIYEDIGDKFFLSPQRAAAIIRKKVKEGKKHEKH